MWGMERLRLRFSKIPFIFIALPILILIQFIPVDTFGIMSLRWYFIFFVFGYLANHYKVSNKIAYTSLLLFPLCLYLFKWLTPYEERNYAFQGFAFVGRAILNGQWMLIGVTLLVALLGIGFIFGIAKIIQKVKMGKFFIYLGVSSIGIYLLHILFVGIVNNFWLNTVLDIGLSIAIYEVLKRNHTTNWLLFGGKRREKYVA
jgi:hypothetical protein